MPRPLRSQSFASPFLPTASRLALVLSLAVASACGPQDPAALSSLDLDAPFVLVPRTVSSETRSLRQRALRTSAAVDPMGLGDDFYLAINKKELGTANRWFLSSYLRQSHPAGVYNAAATSLGLRVVSFKQQNSRLMVYDTDSRKQTSDVFNPELLVDAYPQVAYPPFDRLPGSSQFVLFDPAAGLNRFAVVGDAFASGETADRVTVDLAYSQRARETASKDGITFELVFSGYSERPIAGNPGLGEDNVFRVAGTLGIGLRRYGETLGFSEAPVAQLDGQDLYFRAANRLIPNEAAFAVRAIKWGVSAGKPVEFVVSDTVDKIQADPRFAGYDLYGAIAKGVTNWNAAFGFDALRVRKATKDDDFAQDDKNFILVDTDPNLGASFANWRSNPNTGEVRGASVYFSPFFIELADLLFDDDPPAPLTFGSRDKPHRTLLSWDPLRPQRGDDPTLFWASTYKGARPGRGEAAGPRPSLATHLTALTKKQKVEQYITHNILREIGHTLGLRHNFKGSLKFDETKGIVTSSVMDHLDDFDAVFADKPGSYDIAAVKLLYGLSTALPSDAFCNETGPAQDPDCAAFDRTEDPYTKVALADYQLVLKDYLDGLSPVAPNTTLNAVLGYVRRGRVASVRAKALADAWNTSGYAVQVGKVDATKLATVPGYGARTDLIGRRVIQRLLLDAPALRGRFTNDPQDAAILSALFTEAVRQIKNEDKIRSVDTRRVLAGWMKRLQTIEAYRALAVGASQLDAEIRAGIPDPEEAIKAEDTLKYMDSLLSPYFN